MESCAQYCILGTPWSLCLDYQLEDVGHSERSTKLKLGDEVGSEGQALTKTEWRRSLNARRRHLYKVERAKKAGLEEVDNSAQSLEEISTQRTDLIVIKLAAGLVISTF